jgi:uncharacterized protein (TIGR00369 family)
VEAVDEPTPRVTLEDARRVLADTGFGPWWGMVVDAVGPGTAILRLPHRPEFERPGGLLQGACVMALSDAAFWLAAMTSIGEEKMALTLEMKTNFLKGAKGSLRCEARVLQAGRRVVYGEASCFDDTLKRVSHHTLTYLRP